MNTKLKKETDLFLNGIKSSVTGSFISSEKAIESRDILKKVYSFIFNKKGV